jgi:hypothetical protein
MTSLRHGDPSPSYSNSIVRSVPAGSGTLLTIEFEYEGDGSPCLSDVIASDPSAGGLDIAVTDCLTINASAPCEDVDADDICDDVDDCVGEYDCAGECGGDADASNNQQCCEDGGGAWMGDSCCSSGVVDCNGDCNGSAVEDCSGECGGSAEVDECGVCNGDGSSCAPGVFGLALNDDGNLDVTYETSSPIFGFQFNVDGATITGVSGCAAEAAGFMVSSSATTVVGFSLTAAIDAPVKLKPTTVVALEDTMKPAASAAQPDTPVIVAPSTLN